VSLLPLPQTTITDSDVAGALGRAVQLIDPLLDVLWGTDPLGLKKRTHHLDAVDGSDDGVLDRVQDGMAWALNAGDVPGTAAWAEMDLDARINWWVWRVGALDTVVVAFPGFLGAIGDQLPIQDLFGFVSQAIVLCAVAREHGITDHDQQVRLLAAVLCHRELGEGPTGDEPSPEPVPNSLLKLRHTLWSLIGLLAAVSAELAKRPQPRRVFRYLGMLPAVGAVVDYVGELGALVRAAKAGRHWLATHPTDVTASARPVP
jgi:hypothetical protein